MSDGTTQASTHLSSLAWLTLKTYAGALTFCTTENGNIGLFEGDKPAPLGIGDTADEALIDAHRSYHLTPELDRCDCRQLEADGDVLP